MQEIVQLLAMLVTFYATLGIMAIGFGMMIGHKAGATAAGNFFFVRPVLAVLEWSRTVLVGVVVGVTTPLIGTIKRWIVNEFKEVGKDLRWVVTRERGWLRRR